MPVHYSSANRTKDEAPQDGVRSSYSAWDLERDQPPVRELDHLPVVEPLLEEVKITPSGL